MSEELDILKIVADNPAMSQRKMSEQTGISLGQVNFLIKKCAKKGLIKIEGQTARSVKYNITPKGIAEKAALTMEYIKISYGAVITLTDKIRALARGYEGEGKKIYVYGAEDEMMGICKLALGDRASYIYTLTEMDKASMDRVCFYWDSRGAEEIISSGVEGKDILWVNVLD